MAVRPEPPSVSPASKRRALPDFGRRVLSALVLGPIFLVCAWLGGWLFVAWIVLLCVAATYEFQRILKARDTAYSAVALYAAAVVLPCLAWTRFPELGVAFVVLLLFFSIGQNLVRGGAGVLHGVASTLLGMFYISGLFAHLVLLRRLPDHTSADTETGFLYVLLCLVIVWVSDTGAYLVGSTFGKHKLAPRISPGKSVEGALGALLLTMLAVWVLSRTLMQGHLDTVTALLLGFFGSLVGQVGDLFASQMKREADMKDASKLIPGHGGVLDRFDSILWVAPLIYYAMLLFFH